MSFLTQWDIITRNGGLVTVTSDTTATLDCPLSNSEAYLATKMPVNLENAGIIITVPRNVGRVGIMVRPDRTDADIETYVTSGYGAVGLARDLGWGLITKKGGGGTNLVDPSVASVAETIELRFYRDGANALRCSYLANGVQVLNEPIEDWVFGPAFGTSVESLFVYVYAKASGGWWETPNIQTGSQPIVLGAEEVPPEPEQLAVTVSPSSASLRIGGSQTFQTIASGGVSPYTFQWMDDESNLLGTSTSYTFNAVQVGAFRIRVQATDSQSVSAISPIVEITVSATPPPTTGSDLHQEGRWLKDASGNIFLQKSVNVTGFTDSCVGYLPGQTFGRWNEAALRNNYQTMKNWGLNHVRLILNMDWWIRDASENLDGTSSDRSYRWSIKEYVRIAKEYGIYVSVAPWMFSTGSPQIAIPWGNQIIPDKTAFANWWVSVASELGQFSNVEYEFSNEPYGNETAKQDYIVGCTQAIQAIRALGDNHICQIQWSYQGNFKWVKDNNLPAKLGTNVQYSCHVYADGMWDLGGAFGQTYQGGTYTNIASSYWTLENVRTRFREHGFLDVQTELNVPVMIGEISGMAAGGGSSSNSPILFANALKVLEEMGVGFSAWVWRPGVPGALITGSLQPTQPINCGQVLYDYLAEISPPPTETGTLEVRTTPSGAPIIVGGVAETTPFGPVEFTVGQVPIVYGYIQGYYTPEPVTAQIVVGMNTLVEQTYTPIPPPTTYDLMITVVRNLQPTSGATVKLVSGPTALPDQVTDLNGRAVFLGLLEGNYRFDAYYIPESGTPEYGTVTVDPSTTSTLYIMVSSTPTPKPSTLPFLLGAGLVIGSVIYKGTRNKKR